MQEWIGWVATALFTASYFFKERRAVLAIQGLAAGVWIGYGLSIQARPIVVANGAVAMGASWALLRSLRQDASSAGPPRAGREPAELLDGTSWAASQGSHDDPSPAKSAG